MLSVLVRVLFLCFIEAKSVTLVKDGVALFPDAPTQRGRRHLGELARARAEGHRAAVVFVVQRDDAVRLWRNSAASRPTTRPTPPLARLCGKRLRLAWKSTPTSAG